MVPRHRSTPGGPTLEPRGTTPGPESRLQSHCRRRRGRRKDRARSARRSPEAPRCPSPPNGTRRERQTRRCPRSRRRRRCQPRRRHPRKAGVHAVDRIASPAGHSPISTRRTEASITEFDPEPSRRCQTAIAFPMRSIATSVVRETSPTSVRSVEGSQAGRLAPQWRRTGHCSKRPQRPTRSAGWAPSPFR